LLIITQHNTTLLFQKIPEQLVFTVMQLFIQDSTTIV